MMTIHVASEKIKDGHVHKVVQSPSIVVGRNITDLSGHRAQKRVGGGEKMGKSNAKLSCSSASDVLIKSAAPVRSAALPL